eukprot:TRINITY_DN79472_c0_g1_i1.p1 TRINITY_DN79472_c0_g1~~TRINITY_DN79472_c0_g1_i1.p1  ORF type:complete len:373 (-),score=88.06 TRINITY_DN79472_c0_g1_i1:62-1057(-)
MMSPTSENASPQAAQAQQAQQAQVVGGPSVMVRVAVPTGAVPGQQINFTMPSGQQVSTSLQEHVQPGTVLTVSVPTQTQQAATTPQSSTDANTLSGLQQVLLPQPQVSLEEADRQAAKTGWIIYLLSLPICCCCSPLCGLILWSGLALHYFCKPFEERRLRPRQFAPACAAVSTAGVMCACCLLMGFLMAMVVAMCSGTSFDDKGSDIPDICQGVNSTITFKHPFKHHFKHPFFTHHDLHDAQPLPAPFEEATRPTSLKVLTEGENHEFIMPTHEAVSEWHSGLDIEPERNNEWHSEVVKDKHFPFNFNVKQLPFTFNFKRSVPDEVTIMT